MPPVGRAHGPLRASGGVLLLMVAVLAACGSAPTPAPSIEPTGTPHATSICAFGTEQPDDALADVTENILRRRLEAMGIEAVITRLARCIQVTVAGADPVVEAALLGSGQVRLVHVPAADLGTVIVGRRAPNGLQTLVVEQDLDAATSRVDVNGRERLELAFTDAAQTAFAAWTAANVGQVVALVVDGMVVATMPIDGPSADGLAITVPAESPIPVAAIVALARFGPLPAEWQQPETPQG